MMWFAIYFTGMIASLIMGVYYSINARRRGLHPLQSRMTLGKMNISLGCLLILFGLNQFSFQDLDSIRIGVAFVMLLVGIINLVIGIKHYTRNKQEWLRVAETLK
ncbi:hypothetical protein EEL32_10480 [Brevibacillus laterosporus]|nr:hypothetical protein EEL32_10480 [Brevibacillus laterosporus]